MIVDAIDLGSNLCVKLLDQTQHYFGGYYHVRVLAYCDIQLQRCMFNSDPEFTEAVGVLGESIRFERILDKMAVPASDVEIVRGQLIQTFKKTVSGYLSSPGFVTGFIRSELSKYSERSVRARVSRA